MDDIDVYHLVEQTSTSKTIDEIHNQPSPSTVIPPKRQPCPYGTSCYRTNPIHRQENIHPGDSDWDSDEEKEDDDDHAKPVCPYGNKCYRTNPDHLNEYDHSKAPTNKPRSNFKCTSEYEEFFFSFRRGR